MSFVYKQRNSPSPFVQTIWHAVAQSAGNHITPADGSWDIIIIKTKSTTKVILNGPLSKATVIHYIKDSEYLGIRFSVGTYLPKIPTRSMLDVIKSLPKKSKDEFVLNGLVWQVPEYDTVEKLIEGFAKKKLIARDEIIEKVLEGEVVDLSLRSIQRRFLKVTGMTQTYLQFIKKARVAAAMLKEGKPILDVVFELGYSDQAHMTRIIKQLTGFTPSKIDKK